MHSTQAETDALIKALRDIVKEVAGGSTPYSGDSYLPPFLIDQAQDALKAARSLT